jgi:hypothetical protein
LPVIDFITLFKKEYDLYIQLKETAGLKQEAIIENNIGELTSIMERETGIISTIERFEQQREDLLLKLAEDNHLEEKNLSFEYLVKLMPEAKRDELKSIREDFINLFNELEKVNDCNRELISDSLVVNDFSLQLILQAAGRDVVYNKPGEKKGFNHIIERKA